MTCDSETAVIAVLVENAKRNGTLPAVFGPTRALRVEQTIFEFMNYLSPDYLGGFWDFYRLSNDGFFMTPPARAVQYQIVSPNGYSGAVSAQAAGIIACLFTYSHVSFRPGFEDVGEQYHLLREYVVEHPEARAIYAAID